MFEVIYYSLTGNTRKVADAIAGELGVEAKNIKAVDTVAQDALIFLGSGYYGAVLVKEISEFIEKNQLQGRKIALFGTSGFGWEKELSLMEKQIANKGVEVVGRFNCFGRFAAVKIGHPTTEELDQARTFARTIVQRVSARQPIAVTA
ncbi:MAG: flavodoxin family protein [Dehalococcoidia bacterium]|nr:flavodoxin family protein [Dehalococcoidia bacterium]MDD5494070.1 flavodoxin family protein [Dehalococcoidia bacterium]